jgi:glycosyltransferase involved in cell wall biosynthesis
MRVLMCTWKDEAHPLAGGAEGWTGGVLRHWVAQGVDVVLASSAVPGQPAREVRDGIDIRRGGGYRHGVHAHARSVFQSAGPFDLVFDQVNTRPFGAPRWVGRTPVVAIAHQVAKEVWDAELSRPVALVGRHMLEPHWLRLYAEVPTFTVSRSSASSLAAYGLRRVEVLPQCADLPPPPIAAVPKEATPTFVTCGRLSRSKRTDHAIDAFRIVARQLTDARLWIIGSGPLEERLARSLPARAELLGRVPLEARNRYMGRAHALLMTSVREGWGLVVSEAASVGTRTIGYAVGGLVDSVAACDGVLVAPDPADLACAMVRHWEAFATMAPPTGTGTMPLADVADRLLRRSIERTGVDALV